MPDPTIDTTVSGVPAPAAGEGGSPQPAAAGTPEPGPQAGAPAAPAAGGDDLKLNERERAFLAGLKDEREKRQAIEQENALLKANQTAPQVPYQQPPVAPAATPAAPQDPFADIDDDEIMTAKDIKAKVMPMFMSMIQQVAGAVAVQQRQAQYSDVTNDDIKTFIPKIVSEDPAIGQVLQHLPGPAQFILAQVLTRYAKKGTGAQPPVPPTPPGTPPAPPADPLTEIARAILANSQKPGAPGSSGGGAMDDVVTLLKNMSPEQYEVYRAEKRKAMGL